MLNFKFPFLWGYILLSIVSMLASCSTENDTMKPQLETIELKAYYDGKGVIFPADWGVVPVIPGWRRTGLTIEQIRRAEEILGNKMDNYMRGMLNDGKIHFSSDVRTMEDTTAQLELYTGAAKKDARKYYRQYIGFVSDKGERIVEINLFNYDTSRGRRMFKNWRKEYILGADGYYTENTVRYFVNLTEGRIQ